MKVHAWIVSHDWAIALPRIVEIRNAEGGLPIMDWAAMPEPHATFQFVTGSNDD